MRARLAILLAGTVALGGCAYGYGDYGPYGGMSVGLGYDSGYGYYGGGYGGYGGYGYPYGPYGGPGYPGYYGGFGAPYYGWYDNYYYPGTGVYVYDSYRRPHVWSDTQKQYWTQRRERVLNSERTRSSGHQTVLGDNWSGFDRKSERAASREDRRTAREQRREQRKSDDTRPR
jgi:hypothetical protein